MLPRLRFTIHDVLFRSYVFLTNHLLLKCERRAVNREVPTKYYRLPLSACYSSNLPFSSCEVGREELVFVNAAALSHIKLIVYDKYIADSFTQEEVVDTMIGAREIKKRILIDKKSRLKDKCLSALQSSSRQAIQRDNRHHSSSSNSSCSKKKKITDEATKEYYRSFTLILSDLAWDISTSFLSSTISWAEILVFFYHIAHLYKTEVQQRLLQSSNSSNNTKTKKTTATKGGVGVIMESTIAKCPVLGKLLWLRKILRLLAGNNMLHGLQGEVVDVKEIGAALMAAMSMILNGMTKYFYPYLLLNKDRQRIKDVARGRININTCSYRLL